MIKKVFGVGLAIIALVTLANLGLQYFRDLNERPSDYFSDPATLRLAEAVMANDRVGAAGLIEEGADVNGRGNENMTLLQWQVLRNDLERSRMLLDLGADPDLVGIWNETAVHLAATKRSVSMLKLLLDRGANPNVTDERQGQTALFVALDAKSKDHIELLIERGADIEHADTSGSTPLHNASRTNFSDYVVRFLELGADPEATDNLGTTFQPSFFRTDPSIMNSTGLSNRRWVIAFLEARGIAVHPSALR